MTQDLFLDQYNALLARRSLTAYGAAVEPVTLTEAQQHLRLDLYGSPLSHPDDALIEQIYIPAARRYCESLSGRALALQVYQYRVGAFPSELRFPLGPVRGITSVTYLDSDGVVQTLDETMYVLDPYTEPGYLYPAVDAAWPATQMVPNAVTITFQAGYDGVAGSPLEFLLPEHYKSAILMMLTHLYENRAAAEVNPPELLQLGLETLLLPSALRRGFA